MESIASTAKGSQALPALAKHQLAHKFEIMRGFLVGPYVDGREHAMLESICRDALDHWEN